MSELLSIIIPCYNEQEMIPIFYKEVEQVSLPIVREYIFVNDGSKDNSLEEIRKLNKKDPEHIRYVSFSRNFGKEAGIYAGLQYAKGDYVVLMDVDLQDPPELLPKMYEYIIQDQYDSVGTRRVSRNGEPFVRSFFARGFYKLINKISDTEIVDGARDYRMMSRQMVNAILNMSEYNRFSKGIFSWVGFNTKYLEFKNRERGAGETTWSFWGLFRYAIDGITSFSTVPLDVASVVGMLLFMFSVLLGIFFFFRTLLFGNPTSGWTSIIVVLFFLGGLLLFFLGIVGRYLSHIFLEVKNRPIFITKETEKDNH